MFEAGDSPKNIDMREIAIIDHYPQHGGNSLEDNSRQIYVFSHVNPYKVRLLTEF